MKEAGVGPIKVIQPVFCVAGGMTVDHVQQNRDAHRVCGINQMLQIIRNAKAAEGKVNAWFVNCELVRCLIG